MLYGKILTLGSEISTKHISALPGQNIEILKFEPGGAHTNQWIHCLYILSPPYAFIFDMLYFGIRNCTLLKV